MSGQKYMLLVDRELDDGSFIKVGVMTDLDYEEEGTILLCVDVTPPPDEGDEELDVDRDTIETNVYVHPDGRVELRERGL